MKESTATSSGDGAAQAAVPDPMKMYLHHANGNPPSVQRRYDADFAVTPEYKASLPDMMRAEGAITGANVPIQQVGVSNFRLPLRYENEAGEVLTLETSVTGSVSLEANLKGINMSRIVRSFYEFREDVFSLEKLGDILKSYLEDVGSYDARIRLAFSYPMLQQSLRSGLEGYQYYDVVLEGTLGRDGRFHKYVEFDFVYSSACPCSAELSEHARESRGAYAIPHNQRSAARVRLEVTGNESLSTEDVQRHCLRALVTETQVMVKREDEQAFAELNGAHIKFVEDAARLLYEQLSADERIADFWAACSHQESLHSHDAVSVIAKGVPGGMRADFMDFRSLAV